MYKKGFSPIVVLLIIALVGTLSFGMAGLISHKVDPIQHANISLNLKNNPQVIDSTKLSGATLVSPIVGIALLPNGSYTAYQIQDGDVEDIDNVSTLSVSARLLSLSNDPISLSQPNKIEFISLKDKNNFQAKVIIPAVAQIKTKTGETIYVAISEAKIRSGQIIDAFWGQSIETSHLIAGVGEVSGAMTYPTVEIGGKPLNSQLAALVKQAMKIVPTLSLETRPLPVSQSGSPAVLAAETAINQTLNNDSIDPYDPIFDPKSGTWTFPGQNGSTIADKIVSGNLVLPTAKNTPITISSSSDKLTVSTLGSSVTLGLSLTDSINSDSIINNSIASDDIKDGTITNTDVSDSAGITDGKLAQITSGNKVAGSAVQLSANGGLENASGLSLLTSCSANQVLKWDGTAWICATQSGGGGASLDVQEGDTTITAGAGFLDFLAADFVVTNSPSGEANVSIDYSNSKIARTDQNETITGNWILPAGSISNATLANSSVTITAGTGLTGGGAVSLGSAITLTSTLGTDITNSEINASAAIDFSKLAALTSGNILVGNGSNVATSVAMSGDVTIDNAGVTTIGTDKVALGTDTTGNYVSSATANKGLTLSGTEGGSLGLQNCANNEILKYSTGSATWACAADSTGGSVNSFETISTTSGTSPVADSSTDTLTLTAGSGITVTGDSTTDTITIASVLGSTIDSTEITNDTIVNADINSAAAIDFSKLAALASGNILVGNGSSVATSVTMSGDVTIDNAGVTTIGADKVALTTDTTGNYVATITAGNGISGASSTEGGTPTIALSALTGNWNQTGAFDIVLNNASSQLKILESAGATFYGTLDVGDLSADATYTLSGTSGTILTTANYTTTLDSTYVNSGESPASGDISGSFTGGLTIDANAVALGTDTTGNYVATVTGNSQISVTGSGSETAGISLSITADSIGDSQLAFNTGQNLTSASTPSFATLTLSNTTSQLVFGTTNTTTISSIAPAANRIATIPALSGNDSFAFLDQAQTLTNKTISGSSNTITNIGNSSIANDAVSLGTQTTGNYVSSATANGGLTLTGTEAASLGLITSCSDNQLLKYTAAGGWACANDATGGGAGNSFETITTTSGTSPVADSSTDTLTLTAGSGITVTGDSTTDAITLAATLGTSIDSSEIVNDTIVNADINSAAAIDFSKLAALASGNILVGNGSNVATSVAVSGAITISNAGVTTIVADSIGDTQLAFNTGQHLTTASSPSFAAQTLSNTTNQLTFGTTNTTTISSIAPAANRTATLPALSADDTFAFIAQAQTLTNKTISGASNTITNIGNSSLTNSSVTVTAGTGLSGGGAVALGSSVTLNSTLGTAIDSSEITDDTITASDLAATITFADGDLIDMSGINNSSATEGFILPQATACTSATANGQICWDNDSFTLSIGNGSTANAISNPFGASIDSSEITNDTIVNADINSAAAIDFSKLAALASGNILVGNGSNVATSVAMSGDITIDNAGVTTIGADKVALGTDTTGNYVATVTGNSQISVSGSGSENAGVSLSIAADSIGDSQLAFNTGQNLTTASSPSFAAGTLSNTTNQLVLGTTNTTTISSTAPSASRTYTIPDFGSNDSFVGLAATQTLTNKTISGASNTLSNIGNSSLTNSSITINTSGILTGGAAVSLGGNITLTATEADTLATVTGRGASTSTTLSLAAFTASDTFVQTYAPSGVTAAARGTTLTPTFGIDATDQTLAGLYINPNTNSNADSGDSLNGINIAAITATAANETAILIGSAGGGATGWNNVLAVNSTVILNGSGVLQTSGLSGTYSSALTLSSTSNAITAGTVTVNSDAITDFTGTGLQMNSGSLETTLGTDITNSEINASAAIAFSKLATLSSGNILVGSAGNVATSVAMSGDVTIDNAGATTIGANSVALGTDTTGNYVSSATANGGLALTGTEGASLGLITSCSDNQILKYTAAGGWACAADSTGGTVNSFETISTTSGTSPVADSSTDTLTLTAGSGVTVTGDNTTDTITLAATLGTSIDSSEIVNDSIVNADINSAAAIDFSKLAALASGNILVGNGSNVATSVAMSGDVTIDNAGATTIGADKVALGTDTTGNYVATVTGNSQISVSGSGSENAGVTLSIAADSIGDSQLAFNTGQNLTTTSTPTFSSLTLNGALTLANAETIANSTDAQFTFGRNDAGTVTITAADDNAVAALNILPGGTAALGLGGASTTAITLTTDGTGDGEVVLPNNSVGNSELVNSSITINSAGILTGGAAVSLGGNITLTATEADTLNAVAGRGASTATALTLSSTSNAITAGTITVNGDAITDFTGTGLALSGNSLTTTLGTAIDSSEITDNTITTSDLAATLTFADSDLIDLSSINNSSATEGLILPQATSCSSATANGQICWDNDSFTLAIGNGTTTTTVSNPFGASIDSSEITNDTIVNADINSAAAIDFSKLAALSSGNILVGNGSNVAASVAMSGDVTIDNAGATTIGTDKVALTTDTTGNYVQSVANGTGITGGSAGSEGATLTLAIDQTTAFTWTGLQTHTNTITDTGSQSTFNLTLGNDANTDTISGIKIAATSATTGDADTVYGLDIANLASADATVLEQAIHVGTGWDNVFDLNGTLISAAELTLLDGVSGTLVTTTTTPTSADISGSFSAGFTVAANAVALATDTTGNYVATVSTGNGLSVSGVGSENATASLSLVLPTATDALSSTTSSGSGLELTASGLSLLQGCANGEILKWNEASDVWACSASGAANSFETISTTSGTPPVADSATDTLTLTAGSGITVTGDSTTDTITLASTLGTAIDSAEITNDTIVNADINTAAAIDFSKLAALTSGNILVGNGSNVATSVAMSGDVTIDNAGATTIGANKVALATDTTGNFVATVAGNSQISVSGSGSEDAAVSLSITADSIGDTQLAFNTGQNLTTASSPTFAALTLSGALTLANSETIANSTDAQFTFGRNDAGTVTITAADNDATAALAILPGGAAAFTLGGSSTTAITFTTDSTGDAEVVLPANSVGNSELVNSSLTVTAGTGLSGGGAVSLGGSVSLASTLGTAIDSTEITNDTILNADINSAAAIDFSKLATLTSGNILVGNGSNVATSVAMSGDVTIDNAGATTIGADKVALTTDTTGNYVASITNGTGVTGGNGGGEGSALTLSIDQSTAFTWTGLQTYTNTITDTGSQNVFNLTLGNDANTDIISAIKVAATSATTGDADTIYGLDLANLTSADGTVLEQAIHIGTGWDNVFDLNGTLISAAELTLLDGVSGTLVTTTTTPTSADISGSFSAGFTVAANSVALTTDTTGNYVSSATANGGLTMTGTEGASLGVLLPAATDALSSTTSSGSGLELTSSGLSLIQGCSNNEILKWNEASDVWTCAADSTGGSVNSFETITTTSGTSPVADSSTDTLTLTAGSGITVTGDSTTDTITLASTLGTAIDSTEITNDVIVNADINSAAAIDFSKLATLTSGNILVGSAGNVATSVAMSGDVTIDNAGATTIGANKVALATDTSGNFVATVTGNSQITVGNSGTEDAAVTLAIAADSIGDSQLAFNTGQNLTTASTPTFAALTLSGALTLANSETIANGTDGQILFTRNDAGTVTINAADDNANADLTIRAGGTGALTLGNASNTSITLTTDSTGDGEVVLPASSIGNAELVNSSITINSAGILTGGAAVSLGGNITLTATEADTLNTVAGRGASTATALTLSSTSNAITAGTITVNSDAITDFTGTGLAMSGNSLTASLGTAIDTSEITDNTITTSDLNATLTFADGDLVDFGSVNNSSTTEGLILPQATACTSATANGQICWDNDSFTLAVGNGTTTTSIGNPFGASIDSSEITNDTIVNADINTAAAIDFSKLATLSSGNILVGNGSNVAASVAMSGDVTIDNAGATTIGADKVALTTDTTGNYVLSITNGTGITGGNGGGEGSALTLAVDQTTAFTWTGLQTHTNTITNTGSQSIFNLTLGNDADTDIISGIKVAATSAATGDADTIYGIDLANLASADGTVLEQAIHVGTGWDNVFDLNGTLISAAELTLLDGVSGTLLTTTSSPTSADISGSFSAGLTVAANAVALTTDTTGNYIASATANGGLTMTGTEGGSLGVLLPAATDALSSTTSSGSGLELTSSGLSLIQGCANNEILKWNEASDIWACAADAGGSGNSFETISTTSGTSPVADSSTDTLTLTAGSGITVTGDSSTDTITLAATLGTDITNSEVNASAAIDFSKLAALSSGNILVGSVGNVATSVAMSGDVTIDNAGATTIGADKVALTTDTTGNYVQSVTNGTGISGGNGGGEGSALTLAVDQTTAFTWTGIQTHTNTITDDGAQSTHSITLGNDANADTVSAIAINVTSTATGDADILYGLNIGNITAQAVVTETAINIGTGWEQAINAGGTLLSLTELQLLDGGVALSELTDSGTLTATTVDINGGAIDGTAIGASSASTGAFTTLSATGDVTMNDAGADNILIGAAADTLTLTSNSLSLTDDNWSISTAGALVTSGAISANGGITTSTSNTALAFTVNGSGDFTFTADSDSQVQINLDDSSTATVLELARLTRTTSSTAADGIGGYLSYFVENDSGSTTEAVRLEGILRDANVGTTPGADFTAYVERDGAGGGLIDGMTVFADAGNKWICGNSNKISDGYDCFGFQIGASNIINFSFDSTNRFNVDYSSGLVALYPVQTTEALKIKTLGDQLLSFDQNNDGNDLTIDTDGQVGIGIDNPVNAFQVVSTTSPQVRFSYDTSDYVTFGVSATGAVTLDANGSGAKFTLSDALQVSTLTSCDTIDTDSSGNFACGTDSGAAASPFTSGSGVITKNTSTDQLRVTSNEAGDYGILIDTSIINTVDLAQITNTGFGTTTDGVDGLSIVFAQADDADAVDTNAGLNISVSAASADLGDILSAISISTTAQTANNRDIGITIGTGFDEDIRFASASAMIRLQDGGQIKFTDGSVGGNTTADLPLARLIEYFTGANYGVMESQGFINIDGSFRMDNFARANGAAATADQTSTGRFGDYGDWALDVRGSGGTATNATFGCSASQGDTNTSNNLNGVLQVALTTSTNTNGTNLTAPWCKLEHGAAVGNNVVPVLHPSNKFIMYYKVRMSSAYTNSVTGNMMWFGADNLTNGGFIGLPTETGTRGGLWVTNIDGTQTNTGTNATVGTQWIGFSRNGTQTSTIACTGANPANNTNTSQWALMRIEARATNDAHVFIDADASNGVAMTECGSGFTNTSAVPSFGLRPAMVFARPYMNTSGTVWTAFVDLFAYVQDDPRDGSQIAQSGMESSSQVDNSRPDPILGADIAENYYFDETDNVETGDVVILGNTIGEADKASREGDRKLLGVIAQAPGLTIGQGSDHTLPVALTGRVPVKVSTKNGAIKIGDPLTSSDIPGVAVLATKPGKILGTAMQDYSDTSKAGKVLADINVGYFLGNESGTALLEQKPAVSLDTTLSTTAIEASATESAGLALGVSDVTATSATVGKLLSFTHGIKVMGDNIIDGVTTFFGKINFKGETKFEAPIEQAHDTAGKAVITSGHRFVDVTFSKQFKSEPLINVTPIIPTLNDTTFKERVAKGLCSQEAGIEACQNTVAAEILGNDTKFAVVSTSDQGFMIMLNKPTLVDLTFSWTATIVTDTNTSVSKDSTELQSAIKTVTESSSDSAQLINELDAQIATTSAVLGSQVNVNNTLIEPTPTP